jgi:hypothetical protein
MPILRRVSEGLARKTSRRSLFGRGAGVAFGALVGAAAGTLGQAGGASAGATVCIPPGPLCACDKCQHNGVCAKPCVILTTYYASGCWTTGTVTCCDCDCHGLGGIHSCGCASDYHNNPANCPPT